MRKLSTIFAMLIAVALAVAAPAGASAGATKVIADCNAHGKLTQSYTVAQLRGALTEMPADVKEYTDCNDVVQRALLAAVGASHPGGTGGSGGSGGSFLPGWLIVVLVLLALTGVTLGAVEIRRRRASGV